MAKKELIKQINRIFEQEITYESSLRHYPYETLSSIQNQIIELIEKEEEEKQEFKRDHARLTEELGYDPDRDPMQDHWDHESDKIAIQQEFHDNETS